MTGKLVGRLLREDGTVYLDEVLLAETWWSRFRGLQFLPELPERRGLILRPCASVHTFCMRFPIHVIFLDAAYRVIECRPSVLPWRTVLPRQSGIACTLEVNVRQDVPRVGEQLTVIPFAAEAAPLISHRSS